MSRWLCALVVASTCCAADLRQEVLQAIFPGMEVVTTTRHRNDSAKGAWVTYPDAMAAEPIFQVNGAPANEIERCAAEDMGNETFSRSREVRLRVFEWPRARADVVAVVQYRFIGANPAGSCWSIALLAHLTRSGRQWGVVGRRLMDTMHHRTLLEIRLVDLTGDGIGELVVDADSGGAGTRDSSLTVFDLSGHRLRPILETTSRLEYMTDEFYSQVLDVQGSVAQEGRAVCFKLTTYVKDGEILHTPRVSHECYPTGTGVDEREIERLNHQLRPVIQ